MLDVSGAMASPQPIAPTDAPVWSPTVRPARTVALRRGLCRLVLLSALSAVSACGGGGESTEGLSPEAADYELLLGMFPADDPGSGPDVFAPGLTEQPETLAYVLKSEALLTRPSERAHKSIERLLAISDRDEDGTAGWGIDQPWDAFGDGTVNPRHQVYMVTNAIALDGLLTALQAGIVPDHQLAAVRSAVSQALLASMSNFTEQGDGGYWWYSTAAHDAYYVPNVSAYLAGVAQKAITLHSDWFTAQQHALLRDRIDRAVRMLIAKTRTAPDGLPYWPYVEDNVANPNDLVHHGYTVLGLWTYRHHGGQVPLSYDAGILARSMLVFLRDGKPTEYPQNRPDLDAELRDKRLRVWAPGFAIEVLTVLGHGQSIGPFVASLKADFGTFPDVRYSAVTATPPPPDEFYPRIAAHCLPGLARRAVGNPLP